LGKEKEEVIVVEKVEKVVSPVAQVKTEKVVVEEVIV
jgi:hypothetical protein